MKSSKHLLSALEKITGTGSFCSVGSAPFFLPELTVDGVGEIAFPLTEAQARELSALAEVAPYGKGEQTVRDELVRKCWQIDAKAFRFESRAWTKHLEKLLECVRKDLGIEGKISAHPYKLLIYGEGGHFKAHKDTEKLDAMFGSLIVAVPSVHEGGILRIRHGGEEVVTDFSTRDKRHSFQHVAFFADCEHEVEPVRSGYRCCVVYNLKLDAGDPQSLNRAVSDQAKLLVQPLEEIRHTRKGKLTAVLLEHSYTEANFSLANLKGHDATRARAMLLAAKDAKMTAHLGLVTYHQSGELQGAYDRYWEDRSGGDDDGEIGEIYEESLSIENWRTASDRRISLGEYFIEKEDLLTTTPFDELEPDKKESEGYTGNAGCTMDYWYHRAAVVFWAEEDEEEICCRYDFVGACSQLLTLAKNCAQSARFQRLAAAAISQLPDKLPRANFRNRDQVIEKSSVALVLQSLALAKERKLLDSLLKSLPDEAWLHVGEKAWNSLLKSFGPTIFEKLVDHLMAQEEEISRPALFDLLLSLARKTDAESMIAKITAHLAKQDPLNPPGIWGSKGRADAAELRVMLSASLHIHDSASSQAVVDFVCADRSLNHIRDLLGPVLLEKSSRKSLASPTGSEVLVCAKKLLAEETARPIHPFPDWTRACPQAKSIRTGFGWSSYASDDKKSAAFQDLKKFMADPETRECDLRYTQGIRSELESFIRSHQLDLDTKTNTKGRPHGLVCTKNDHSYHRALKQRAADEQLLMQLKALPSNPVQISIRGKKKTTK